MALPRSDRVEGTLVEGTSLARPGVRGEIEASLEGARSQNATAFYLFLILVGLVSALTCCYFYQARSIREIQAQTYLTAREAERLERENAPLQITLARLQSPENIHREAIRLRLVPGREVIYVPVPPAVLAEDRLPAGPTARQWHAYSVRLQGLVRTAFLAAPGSR